MDYCRQDLVEKFVSQCNVCAARHTRIQPFAGIPIIEQKFISRLQVNLLFSIKLFIIIILFF